MPVLEWFESNTEQPEASHAIGGNDIHEDLRGAYRVRSTHAVVKGSAVFVREKPSALSLAVFLERYAEPVLEA